MGIYHIEDSMTFGGAGYLRRESRLTGSVSWYMVRNTEGQALYMRVGHSKSKQLEAAWQQIKRK